MKKILLIDVDDDWADYGYSNFSIDYDLRAEDEDGNRVSISYVEECELKDMPRKMDANDWHGEEFWFGFNEALSVIAANCFPEEYFEYLMEKWSKPIWEN